MFTDSTNCCRALENREQRKPAHFSLINVDKAMESCYAGAAVLTAMIFSHYSFALQFICKTYCATEKRGENKQTLYTKKVAELRDREQKMMTNNILYRRG